MKQQKQSGFSHHLMMVIVSVLGILGLLGLVYWQNFVQHDINKSFASSQTDSDIVTRLNKAFPGAVSSVEIVKKTPLSECTLNCPPDRITDYEYEGYYYPVGAKFKMPFDIWVSAKGKDYSDTVHMDSYNPFGGMGQDKRNTFIAMYEKLGYKYLNYFDKPNFDYVEYNPPLSSPTVIAGYNYSDLYIVRSENGEYLYYYYENTKNWVELTSDGQHFIDWVNEQGSKGLALSQIDWTTSPIKPYSQ